MTPPRGGGYVGDLDHFGVIVVALFASCRCGWTWLGESNVRTIQAAANEAEDAMNDQLNECVTPRLHRQEGGDL